MKIFKRRYTASGNTIYLTADRLTNRAFGWSFKIRSASTLRHVLYWTDIDLTLDAPTEELI